MALPFSFSSELAWSAFKNGRGGPFVGNSPTSAVASQTDITAGAVNVGNTSTVARRAQSFTASASGDCYFVRMICNEVGTIADSYVAVLYSDNSGTPDTVLGTSAGLATADLSAVSGAEHTFTFSTPVSLTSSTRYWLSLERTGSVDASNYVVWRGSNSNPLASENGKSYNSGTGLWGAADTTIDAAFTVLIGGAPGALYAMLIDGTNNTLEAWYSTDSGDSWAEADSANHPAISDAGASYESYDAVQSGTMAYCTYLTASELVVVRPFDLTNGAWGTVTGNGSALDITSTVDGHITTTAALMLARRSDGDYIVLRQGDAAANMGTSYRRVTYSRHEGSSWTNETDVAELSGSQVHADARAIAIDAADRAYLFYTKSSGGLFCKTLTSANSLGSETTVDSSVAHTANYSTGHAAWVDDSTDRIVIVYVDSDGDTAIAYANVGDTPSWSSAEFTATNDAESANSNPGSIALDGTTIYVFWPDDSTQDIYRDSCVSGTWTFGADTEYKDAITCNGISIGKLSAGIGILYLDGSTVKYDNYGAATGATGTISSGSLSVSGQTVTAQTGVSATVSTGSHAVSGQAVSGTVSTPATGTVDTGSLAVSGQAVAATTGVVGSVSTGSHAVSGQAVAATTGVVATVATGELAVTGQAVIGAIGDTGTVATGTHTVAGQTVQATTGVTADIATGSHTVAGQSVSGDPGVTGNVSTGSHTVTGQTVDATTGVAATVSTGSHAVAGQTVTAQTGTTADIASGALAVSGQTVDASTGTTAQIDTGSYAVSGQTVDASVTAGDTGSIASGSLAMTGQTVDATTGTVAQIDTGTLSVSGQTVDATVAVTGDVTSGSYVVSGQTVDAATGVTGTIDSGTLVVSGQSVTATTGTVAQINTGSLTVEGQAVEGTAGVADQETGTVATGTLAVSGQSVSATTGTTADIGTGALVVTGNAVAATVAVTGDIETGTVAVSGQAVLATVATTGSIDTSALIVEGQSVTAAFGQTGTIDTGILTVTGQLVTAIIATAAIPTAATWAVDTYAATMTADDMAATFAADDEIDATWIATGGLGATSNATGPHATWEKR